MRRSLLVVLAIAAFPCSAAAAPVLMLGHDGRVTARNDPFVNGPAVTPAPASAATNLRAHAATAKPTRKRKPPERTVLSELARLERTHAIDAATYLADTGSYNAALTEEKQLTGTRRAELSAVTETLHTIAASKQLTPSRLPALFATLAANRQWWAHGSLLSSGARVEFAGSQLVWEYYPGQGIQLQVLGSFGKADGLYTAGAADYPQLVQLLSQLIPLAAQRGGGLTWEYYFAFDGGAPPWTSAMSQATGLEALTRAYQATQNPYYLQIAARAMPIFGQAPPVGVNVRTSVGTRFLQYTFAPRVSIINAFLQTLIGLYDYGQVSGNVTAQQLFDQGNAEAQAEVPQFDTGAWSLYQPGVEDTLDYHELVTGFLGQLCTRTGAPVYCTTAQHFSSYLRTLPTLADLTASVPRARSFSLRFRLSKVSHVGVVITRGASTVFSTSASFGYGIDQFTVPALKAPGGYSVRLAATDLAGNFARITGTLTVRP
ncbi:MAG: D-glucuronyl C5-epimerase family protein [Solirubrobacteraceae bacterium]